MIRFGRSRVSRCAKRCPDGIVRQAAEIVAVDVTPDALLNRLKRGAIYKPEMVEKALSGFFKGSNLGALRELTLRQAAHEVDLRQSAYDETRGFQVPAHFRSASQRHQPITSRRSGFLSISRPILRPPCSFVEDGASLTTSMPIARLFSCTRLLNWRNCQPRNDRQ